ncbi:MAG: MFS transporter [Trichodesmium sp. MO_231.B1]|nr:MFS transporter [Trichodesmium sp. MO_231.B1]
MNRAKKNVLLLVLCQALAMTGITILGTIAGLIGQSLAADKSLATLPLALLMLGTMSTTIPASLLMKQWGRQFGFIVGVLIGMVGSALGVYAIFSTSFSLFCLAILLFGVFNGFAGFYRFAAIDAATDGFRHQAVSLVVGGGVIAAFLGPGLATWSKDWFTSVTFAGSLVSIIGLQLIAAFLLLWIDIPLLSKAERQETGRPLTVIMQQPVFIIAVLNSVCGYGVMILVMTATPLAMVAYSHSFEAAASVMQWHVLGMFGPSFVTGFIIAKFGRINIILWGVMLNLLCIVINLQGNSITNFTVALLMLGIGWNFMFVGSTTFLTEAYTPAEKAKTQAIQDFIMFGFVTLATFFSGRLLHSFSWQTVNYVAFPPLMVTLAVTLWLRKRYFSSAYSKSYQIR